jgi:hypothetical protein
LNGFASGYCHSFADFKNMSHLMEQSLLGNSGDSLDIESRYWETLHDWNADASVEYASDLDVKIVGSGFYNSVFESCSWNLNKLPLEDKSLLKSFQSQNLSGVIVPWLCRPYSNFS